MNVTEWAPVQNQVGALQIILGGPHDLMMFMARGKGGIDDIYIGLPNRKLLETFPGFVEIERESLPDYLSTLVVRNDGFDKRFPDIFKKCRSRF
jgi:hypothetical protein